MGGLNLEKSIKKNHFTISGMLHSAHWDAYCSPSRSTAEAAAKYYLPSSYRNMVFYSAPDDLPATYVTLKVYQKGSTKKPKASSIKSLASSDSSIARPYIDRYGNIRVYFFKKAGTATVSFQIGKQTLKSKITVKEYSNPLSRFKIGKKIFFPSFHLLQNAITSMKMT